MTSNKSAPSFADTIGIVEPQERLKALTNYGNMIEVDPNMPVTRYYRSGTEMLRMAHVYLSEGNHGNAFILYMKYMTLFIEKIRTHPGYPQIKSDVKAIHKVIKEEIMPTTEKLRAKLLEHYQKEYEQFLASKEAEKAKELERERQRQRQQQQQNNKSSSNGSATLIPLNLHVQMDADMQPTAPDMSMLDQVVYPNDFPYGSNRGGNNLPSGLLLPAMSDMDKSSNSLPGKPAFDRNQKPSYDRSNSLLAGSLRTVVVPQNTMDVFLQQVRQNTANNIETCGILAGHLSHNRMLITHIIIPKQQGTADSCNTMNEEEIFAIQDQQNLITLGWIHTHPSQTSFLSSVDLHTHCGYQMMMPEAIAIVCAPKFNQTGFFILTPIGLDFIGQCRQTGFHPHPNDPPLFMDAQHIQMDSQNKIQIVDLRR